jgi:hypothetical protein
MNSDESLMENYVRYCGENNVTPGMMKIIAHIGKPRDFM